MVRIIKQMLILLIIFSFKAHAAKICYFSFNNASEFKEMDKLASKLNAYANEKIEIKEFLTPGDNAEEAFTNMVTSGEKCDGLVISGHHTGSFGGKNSKTTLSIDHMETLSCNPQYKDFFSNIKALWLQGCRTLGVGKIEINQDPDFHTRRVGEDLATDQLPQNLEQLNMEFSATLDQENPLSSRYLRVFPRATTFGWTKTAPGVEAHSEYSIPYHIANIAKINDDRGHYFDNPIGEKISPESAVKYLISLEQLLNKSLISPQINCDRKEKNLVLGWNAQGQIKLSKYSFNNPELNAFESLNNSNNEALVQAGKLNCLLKNSDDSLMFESLDLILKNEGVIGFSFNSIYETLQRLKKEGKFELLQKVQDKLKRSELLQKFLMRKLSAHELGILRKIDYYAFWKDMTNNSNSSIEKQIGDAFVQQVSSSNKDDQNHIDYTNTLFQSMTKHKLITANQLKLILSSPKPNANAYANIANAINESDPPLINSEKML